jgi:hypothetical protein
MKTSGNQGVSERDDEKATVVGTVTRTAPAPHDIGQNATETANTPPGGEFSREGGGVPASPSTGVGIYSRDDLKTPQKKSTADGGDIHPDWIPGAIIKIPTVPPSENLRQFVNMASEVDTTIRRLLAGDATVRREDIFFAAADRLTEAAMCFSICGLSDAGRLLRKQGQFALEQSKHEKKVRLLREEAQALDACKKEKKS